MYLFGFKLPDKMIGEPLVKYLPINSARFPKAEQDKNNVSSFLMLQATEKLATAVCSFPREYNTFGSEVNLPFKVTFTIYFTPSKSVFFRFFFFRFFFFRFFFFRFSFFRFFFFRFSFYRRNIYSAGLVAIRQIRGNNII